ncbi:hypothetical protein [Nocardioides abyssi]|uniref:Uncharacterized protein n=1 Tax=Nocardioides abyssi TaxID=3058370 RepID=A0ABT8ER75_9ACTN|nr:hypothetical protein [Nocardioides abyssi]MDN4160657.1 hypothetical protein [Nocardioides abyssi]
MPDLLRGRAGTALLLGVLTPAVLAAATWVVLDARGDGPEGYVPAYTAEQSGRGPGQVREQEPVPDRRRQEYLDFARRAVTTVVSGDVAAVRQVVTPTLGAALADLPLGAADVGVRALGLTTADRAGAEALVLLGGQAAAPVLVTVDASGERMLVFEVRVDLTATAGPGADEADPARRRALAAAGRVVGSRGAGEPLAAGLTTYSRDRASAVVAAATPAGPVGLVVRLVRENGRWVGQGAELVR